MDPDKNTIQSKLPGVSLGEKPSDNDHVDASPKNADLVSATSSEQLGEETTTEKVPGDLYTTTSAGSQINISSDGNSSNADTDTENVLDKTLCTEGSGDNMLSSGVPCNAEKGNEINQELHSVLQEPSIMDEERSIPFSYSAFEYSS
ncbi:hypothetical protein PVT01_000075300 [Plasmodium vivax]|uniref:VIR protein n=1 Tax=Plasmodium vivax TaxID=5855 RepID=A0A1G4E761_PLAVI|nr:hypothetical protein PVT01_000075300 [Plasmodium vivax]